MAGLLGDVLPYVYSRGNALRRGLLDMVENPAASFEQTAGLLMDKDHAQRNVLAQAFSNPKQPFQVTDPNALRQATQGVMNGLLGFAPVGMTKWGDAITKEQARALLAGKTEKVGGVDPATWIDNTSRDVLSYGRIPLSAVRANEAGALYDGTVNQARAMEYAQRPAGDVPPVVLVTGRRTGGILNVLDGGHRVTAARLRGDEFIPAIVMEHSPKQ